MRTPQTLIETPPSAVSTPFSSAQPKRWFPRGIKGVVPDVANGILQGLLIIFSAIAYSVLVFAHVPGETLAIGVGVFVTGTCVMCFVIAVAGKLQPALAGPQDTMAVVLALMATAVSADVGAQNSAAVLPTMLVLILFSIVALGGTYLVLGWLRLGQVIRYLPYPVIGGFLAGAGWLLVVNGVGIATARPTDVSTLQSVFSLSTTTTAQIILGLAFGLLILLAQRIVRHYLTIIVTLLAGLVAFYAILNLQGISVEQARNAGWLLASLPSRSLLQVRWIGALSGTDWGLISTQLGNIFTLVAIGVVAALLNLAGIEVAYHRSTDVNHELRTLGTGIVLSGLVGGAGGYNHLSRSILAYRGGARSALVPLVAGILALATLLGGSALLGLVPRFLLAGITVFLGASLLLEWVYAKRTELPRAEYGILLLIAVVVAVAGFFTGVVVGILAAVALFAFNYSRSGVIKHALTGTAYRSNVDRPLDQERVLRERGGAIHIFELQGYVFFGTAYSVLEAVRHRAEQTNSPILRYAILDFRNVTGLDSSAAYSFSLLRQLAVERGFMLIFTSLSAKMRATLSPSGDQLVADGGAGREADEPSKSDPANVSDEAQVFDDIDHALEWCENALLADIQANDDRTLAQRLSNEMGGSFTPEDVERRLLAHFERIEVPEGEYLTHEGAPESDIFLISAGRVAVIIALPDGQQLRLRVMQAGSLLGELSFYRNTPRTASVVALEPTTCYRITWGEAAVLQLQDADIVAAFHAYVARVLSERLTIMNGTVAALLR